MESDLLPGLAKEASVHLSDPVAEYDPRSPRVTSHDEEEVWYSPCSPDDPDDEDTGTWANSELKEEAEEKEEQEKRQQQFEEIMREWDRHSAFIGRVEKYFLEHDGAALFSTREERVNLWQALANATWKHAELGNTIEHTFREAGSLCASLEHGRVSQGYEYLVYYCASRDYGRQTPETTRKLNRLGFFLVETSWETSDAAGADAAEPPRKKQRLE